MFPWSYIARRSNLPRVLALWAAALGASASADDFTDDEVRFFETQVRPLLAERCQECHGQQKQESGLRVDSRTAILAGGDRGPAIVPSRPDESLLLHAVRQEGEIQMPPDTRLSEEQVATLGRWIELGAPWPENDGANFAPPKEITPEQRAFWSFQPVADSLPPEVRNSAWPQSPVDRFILSRLEAHNLHPVEMADKRMLIRRATYDLTGLPPTPEEIQEFVADQSPEAFAQVVDRLLSSQAYGERWGRHWLDVVRYADTAGETADFPVREAYLYRNYVIQSFNDDKPYDQFLREQIAGDVLPTDEFEDHKENTIATGFLAVSRRFGYDEMTYHHLCLHDSVDTVGQAVLGLTLGCARCHDHKYDPISMEDYYALYGIFACSEYPFPGAEHEKRPAHFAPLVPAAEAGPLQQKFDAESANLDAVLKQVLDDDRAIQTEMEALRGNPTQPSTSGAAFVTGEESGSDGDRQLTALKDRAEQLKKRRSELEKQRSQLVERGPYPVAYAVSEGQPQNVRIHQRGDPARLGDEVPRRFLEILGGDGLPDDCRSSGRLELAGWLTRPENPLTARVMVNRIWQYHFGDGLVTTPSDFGQRGGRPTHPELLDYLATRFVESGWSVKEMHRLIMLSAVYQLSNSNSPQAAHVDPNAELRWRFSRRRLSAEEIRDSMLSLAGNLDNTMGGPHPFPPVTTWGFEQHHPFLATYETNRRSVYLMTQRLRRHPMLSVFDVADGSVSTAKRFLTTVPTQALFLLNSEFAHEQSRGFARRLLEVESSHERRVQQAHEMALARPAELDEVARAEEFLQQYRRQLEATPVPADEHELLCWSAYCRSLLSSNAFFYVD